MEHLREELRAYASDGEPPMRLEFDKVMTVARRSKRRLQTGVIATSVVAVAVVATLVSVVVSNSPPVDAAGTPAYCKTEPKEEVQKLSCVLYQVVSPELPSGAKLEPVLPESTAGPLDLSEAPGAPRGSAPTYVAFVNVLGPNGSMHFQIDSRSEQRPLCTSDAPYQCEHRRGPRGEELLIMTPRQPHEVSAVAVESRHLGTTVTVWANSHMSRSPGGPYGQMPVAVDGLIRIATAPGLYIP